MSGDYPRFHLYLDKDDVQWYQDYFGKDMGLSQSIRAVMRAFRQQLEATAGQDAKHVAHMTPELLEQVGKITPEEENGK